jgi:hypothetical protein
MRYQSDHGPAPAPGLFDQDTAEVTSRPAAAPEETWLPPATPPWPDAAAPALTADDLTLSDLAAPRRPAPQFVRAAPAATVKRWRRHREGRRPWLADQIGAKRRIRSVAQLLLIAVTLGAIIAAILATVIGSIVVALQHALKA